MAGKYSIQHKSLKAARINQQVATVFVVCFLQHARVLLSLTLLNWPAVYFLETVIFSGDINGFSFVISRTKPFHHNKPAVT